MILKGNNTLSKIYLGNQEIVKAYLGASQVYPNEVSSTIDDLLFTDRVNMNNVAQELTATAGSFSSQAVDALFLEAGQSGRIWFDVNSVANNNTIFGLSTSAAKTSFAGYAAAFDIGSDLAYYQFQSNIFSPTGYTVSVPIKFGTMRVGLCAKPQISVDGINWTDLHIYRGNYFLFREGGRVYPQVTMNGPGDGLCSQPKIQRYAAGNIAKLYINNGNSIAYGYQPGNAQAENNIGQQGWVHLDTNSDWFFQYNALSGQSIYEAINTFPTTTAPLMVDGFSKIIVSYLEGTNQLTGSVTAAEGFALLQTYINLILDTNPRAKAMIYMTPSCNPVNGLTNVKRNDFNDMIGNLIGTNSRIGIGDIRGVPALNDEFAWQDTDIFFDGFHPTPAGLDLIANVGKPVLASL